MKIIVRRIITILPALLLQALWLYVIFTWLAPWAGIINFVLSILAFLFVLYLISKREESNYKVLWLLVILTFPVAGALLYLLFGNKRTMRPLKKKMKAAVPLPPVQDKSAPLYDRMEKDSKRLSQTFRWIQSQTGLPLQKNQEAVYYPLGDEMFPVMLEELEKAEKFIFLEYFIVQKGVMWDTIVEVLERKVSQGVDVRMLYDDLGSFSTYDRKQAEELRKKGIRIVSFNPLVIVKGTLNCRDHRKMMVIDGRVVFSGGINLADEYINRIVRFGHWKDIGFKLTGEAVQNYTRMFMEFWNAFAGDRIPDEYLLFPDSPEDDADDGLVLSYYDSPLRDISVNNELFSDLLSQAQDYAWFYTPYLLPGDALTDAFIRAARRGVDVRIFMPGIPDKKMVFRMSRSFYSVLLEAGVKIYEYTPGFLHAKACLVDDIVGSVGTVNLDYRSLFLHFENNSLFYHASLLKDLKADMEQTQAKCTERTLENIGTGFWKWFLDGILRIFTPLF